MTAWHVGRLREVGGGGLFDDMAGIGGKTMTVWRGSLRESVRVMYVCKMEYIERLPKGDICLVWID